ncbi:MAG: low molecular weight protein arginine phosphatase [Clostridia bacterium]|nr:low molecular weight protein arginine phosphatase [Clostridia bacterium]
MKKEKINLLFVCTGNTCRSPMAEQMFADYLKRNKNSQLAEVSSAGIYADNGRPMTPEAAGVLAEMGLTVKPHKSRLLTVDLIQNADVIVCMTENHRTALTHTFTYEAAMSDGKTRVVGTVKELIGEDLNDPFGQGVEAYRVTANALTKMLEPLYKFINK